MRTLGFLSAAPRVSTRSDAEHGAARSHVLGVLNGFESLGWSVRPFIAGDRLPKSWNSTGSEKAIRSGGVRTLAADIVRLSIGAIGAQAAWREIGGEVDCVYERNAVLQAFGWKFRKKGVPWILEANAPLYYETEHERNTIVLRRLARHLEFKFYRDCDVLVCISETLRKIIIAEAELPKEKVLVMSNGVDIVFFDPTKYKSYRLFDGFTIGFVGKLFGWQGLDLLIDAMSDLKKEGLRTYLVIVGSGSAQPYLKRSVQENNLTENVRFVGQVPREEIPKYISGFDIGYSGQRLQQIGSMYRSPLKLYEYMSMAKPVIASDFEDAKRAITDEKSGYLFQAEDIDDLKNVLEKAFSERAALEDMGRIARTEAVTKHSWAQRISDLMSSIEKRNLL